MNVRLSNSQFRQVHLLLPKTSGRLLSSCLLLNLLCLALLASCGTQNGLGICDDQFSLSLQSQIGRPAPTRAELESWIGSGFSLPEIRYAPPVDPNAEELPPYTEIRWQSDRTRYLIVIQDSTIVRVVVEFAGRGRSRMRDVVECMGQPEVYFAWNGENIKGKAMEMMLLYPSTGTVAWAAVPGGQSSSLDKVRVGAMIYTAPGTAEQMVANARFPETLESQKEAYQWYVGKLRPWPGSWADLEIDSSPRQ